MEKRAHWHATSLSPLVARRSRTRALGAQFQNVNKQDPENFSRTTRMAVGSLFQEAYLGPNCSELPDLSLSALQKRFSIPSELEKLYKRYEQRFQIGKFFRQITSFQKCQRVH